MYQYGITIIKYKVTKEIRKMEKKTEKKKIDKSKLATRIMAGFLALLMVVGVIGTAVFYLVNYVFKK